MKIAFLFLTLDNINWPIFWDKFFLKNKNKYTIYVHPKNPDKITIPWMKKNIIKNLVHTEWGIIVNAYINLMEEAYKDPLNQKFITISESCIPYKSFDELYNFLKKDDIKTSYIKSLPIKKYDWEDRIKIHKNYQKFHWRKHLARFCLSRYHVKILLEKKEQLKFFYKMKVGDEFFLSVLPNKYIKNFAITYDNWTYIENEIKKINKKIEKLYIEIETNKNISNKDKNQIMNKINNYKNQKKKLSPNPKSYIKVYKKDFKDIEDSKAFFWRKFPINSDIIKYEKCILDKLK